MCPLLSLETPWNEMKICVLALHKNLYITLIHAMLYTDILRLIFVEWESLITNVWYLKPCDHLSLQNTFGILVTRWRCLKSSLHMSPANARSVILACCVLHNFLREKRCVDYCPPGFADGMDVNGRVVGGAWRERNVMEDLRRRRIGGTQHRNPTALATEVRDTLVSYFNNDGALPWQLDHIYRTWQYTAQTEH